MQTNYCTSIGAQLPQQPTSNHVNIRCSKPAAGALRRSGTAWQCPRGLLGTSHPLPRSPQSCHSPCPALFSSVNFTERTWAVLTTRRTASTAAGQAVPFGCDTANRFGGRIGVWGDSQGGWCGAHLAPGLRAPSLCPRVGTQAPLPRRSHRQALQRP